MERWCNWNAWCTQLEKLDILLFCKLFSRFMSHCPFSRAEGESAPQKFWFVENSGEIPENSGTEVSTRLFTIELSGFFLRKKTFLGQCKCAHRWAWKIQLSLSGKCSMVWSWAKTNEGLLVGFKPSHLLFAAPPNFHCVWLFASVNRKKKHYFKLKVHQC